MKKELKRLIHEMEKTGWRFEKGPKCHTMCFAPDGKGMISLPHTPSDHNFLWSVRRELKKTGYEHLFRYLK